MKIKLEGNQRALRDSRVQWEIARQLLIQSEIINRTVEVGKVRGMISLAPGETVTEALSLIKSRAAEPRFQGEVEVIKEITQDLSTLHNERLKRLNTDISLMLGVKEDRLKKASSYPEEWFKPPVAVAKEAKRGLSLRRKYKRGGLSTREAGALGIGSGVQRAVDLRNLENMSPKTIKRMVAFFARHRQHKNSRTKGGKPGAGMIAWLLWGGDAGEKWARSVLKRMEKFDKVR